MFHEVADLYEKMKEELSSSRSLGESLGLEQQYLEKLENGWTIEKYADQNQVEHIRCFRDPMELREDSECWELLRFEGEEVPLELLVELYDESTQKG